MKAKRKEIPSEWARLVRDEKKRPKPRSPSFTLHAVVKNTFAGLISAIVSQNNMAAAAAAITLARYLLERQLIPLAHKQCQILVWENEMENLEKNEVYGYFRKMED